jgi:hypothetical protein
MPIKFTQPNLLPIPWKGKQAYMLAEAWEVEVFGVAFYVPAGVVSDGASVPRLLWSLYPPDGLHRAAACLHDCLFALCGVFCGAIWERPRCNLAYRELCLMGGVSKRDAYMMWWGLRLGSWVPWAKCMRNPVRKLDFYEVS